MEKIRRTKCVCVCKSMCVIVSLCNRHEIDCVHECTRAHTRGVLPCPLNAQIIILIVCTNYIHNYEGNRVSLTF